ncbi:MAG: hypothetical protein ACK5Q5_20545 [Planctomycetaceae bacterium]
MFVPFFYLSVRLARRLLAAYLLHEQALARTCSMAHRNAFVDRVYERVLAFKAGTRLCSRPVFNLAELPTERRR